MTRPKDREDSTGEDKGGTRKSGFDDLWTELVDAASPTEASDSHAEGETKAWTDAVRGERARPNVQATDVEAGAPQEVATDRTRQWTDDARAFRKNSSSDGLDAVAGGTAAPSAGGTAAPSAHAKSGEQTATRRPAIADAITSAGSSTAGSIFSILGPGPGSGDTDAADDADAKMAALMHAPVAAAGQSSSEHETPHVEPASAAHESESTDDPHQAAAKDEADVVALRGDSSEPAPDARGAGGRIGLWIAAALALATVGYFALRPTGDPAKSPTATKPQPGSVASAKAVPTKRLDEAPPPAHTPARTASSSLEGSPGRDPARVGKPSTAKPDPVVLADPPAPPPTPSRTGDPREPPPGTPAEIAAVFRKLPVSPADSPPVGGVGETGIHIDDIAIGSAVERSRCRGGSSSFSISAGDTVNVCMRVVHLRQKEELIVLWQRGGGTRRRGKVVVKPAHAYRTRAYLKLRNEDVGDWTVRVLAGEIELASHEFTVSK